MSGEGSAQGIPGSTDGVGGMLGACCSSHLRSPPGEAGSMPGVAAPSDAGGEGEPKAAQRMCPLGDMNARQTRVASAWRPCRDRGRRPSELPTARPSRTHPSTCPVCLSITYGSAPVLDLPRSVAVQTWWTPGTSRGAMPAGSGPTSRAQAATRDASAATSGGPPRFASPAQYGLRTQSAPCRGRNASRPSAPRRPPSERRGGSRRARPRPGRR